MQAGSNETVTFTYFHYTRSVLTSRKVCAICTGSWLSAQSQSRKSLSMFYHQVVTCRIGKMVNPRSTEHIPDVSARNTILVRVDLIDSHRVRVGSVTPNVDETVSESLFRTYDVQQPVSVRQCNAEATILTRTVFPYNHGCWRRRSNIEGRFVRPCAWRPMRTVCLNFAAMPKRST